DARARAPDLLVDRADPIRLLPAVAVHQRCPRGEEPVMKGAPLLRRRRYLGWRPIWRAPVAPFDPRSLGIIERQLDDAGRHVALVPANREERAGGGGGDRNPGHADRSLKRRAEARARHP